jgi:hypothetical protein
LVPLDRDRPVYTCAGLGFIVSNVKKPLIDTNL